MTPRRVGVPRDSTVPSDAPPALVFMVGNPYIFDSAISPLVEQLSGKARICIIAPNFFIPWTLRERLDRWTAEGIISEHVILPFFEESSHRRLNPWKSHKESLRRLAEVDFSGTRVCVFHQSHTPWNRYVMRRLPEGCLKVLETSSNHFADPLVVDAFRNGASARAALEQAATARDVAGKPTRGPRWEAPASYLAAARRRVAARFVQSVDEVIGPRLLVGESFRPTHMELLTGMDDDLADVAVTHQSFLATFLADLYPRVEVIRTSSPLLLVRPNEPDRQGVDRPVLLLLPYLTPTEVPAILDDLRRDVLTTVRQTGATSFSLRPHPRSSQETTAAVMAHLNANGIVAYAANPKPIWETMSEYAGAVGAATSSLIEAAYVATNAFVVGFYALSAPYTTNPRYLVGEIDGADRWVGWIGTDGSFDADTFTTDRPRPETGPTMSDVLAELLERTPGDVRPSAGSSPAGAPTGERGDQGR